MEGVSRRRAPTMSSSTRAPPVRCSRLPWDRRFPSFRRSVVYLRVRPHPFCSTVAFPPLLSPLAQCAILYQFFHHSALRQVHSLVADGEVWGSYDVIPGLALCPVPKAALSLPARRAAALAQAPSQGGVTWIPCMGPADPSMLGVPLNPSTAVSIALSLRGLRVCLPPSFEQRLLLAVTANREVELGLRVGFE